MLTLILIILIAIAAVIVFSLVVFFGRGLLLGGMLAWIGGRSLFRWVSGKPREKGPDRMARIREENRRLIAGESMRQIRKSMKAEARQHQPR